MSCTCLCYIVSGLGLVSAIGVTKYPLCNSLPTRAYSSEVRRINPTHYSDIVMNLLPSQITGISINFSTVCSSADQGKYQNSASLAFVRGIHWWPAGSLHKMPVTQKIRWRYHEIQIQCRLTWRQSVGIPDDQIENRWLSSILNQLKLFCFISNWANMKQYLSVST